MKHQNFVMAEPSQSARPDSDMLQGRINFKLDICPFTKMKK